MRVSFPFRFMILAIVLGLAGCGGGGDDGAGGTGGGGDGGSGGGVPGGGGTGGGGGDGGSGGGGGIPGGGGTGAGGVTGPGTVAAYGIFQIHYKTDLGITSVDGIMRDGAPPEAILWEKSKTDGDCSLYKPRAPFCDSCLPPNVCTADNVCSTPPATYGVGQVSVTGLNSASSPLVLTDVRATTITYQSAETLSLPPCTAGGPIRLDATGEGEFPAFSIDTQCIASLAVTNPTIAIESGKTFTLTWTPGTVAGTRIKLELDLSHHGGSKGRLICDTADTGSLQVPGTLIKSLMDLGVTGWPKADVTRILTAQTPVGSGQAELRVYSDTEFVVQIPDLISCNTDADCPSPQTCQVPGMMCGISCTSDADCPTGQTCLATKICK